ncbi:hypothetical protein PG987_010614 [Apiospora arundinis]
MGWLRMVAPKQSYGSPPGHTTRRAPNESPHSLGSLDELDRSTRFPQVPKANLFRHRRSRAVTGNNSRGTFARSSSTQHKIAGPQVLVDIQKHMVGPRAPHARVLRHLPQSGRLVPLPSQPEDGQHQRRAPHARRGAPIGADVVVPPVELAILEVHVAAIGAAAKDAALAEAAVQALEGLQHHDGEQGRHGEEVGREHGAPNPPARLLPDPQHHPRGQRADPPHQVRERAAPQPDGGGVEGDHERHGEADAHNGLRGEPRADPSPGASD